jgi:hypothetical protein
MEDKSWVIMLTPILHLMQITTLAIALGLCEDCKRPRCDSFGFMNDVFIELVNKIKRS